MERLIIIKKSPAIQLGHLYEHLFCMAVDELFRSNNLFPRLDYALDGKTYHGGLVVIDIELYSKEAVNEARNVTNLSISFEDEVILKAFSTILAELQVSMESDGRDAIIAGLHALQEQKWESIDDFTMLDVKQIRRPSAPLYAVYDKPLKSRKLTVSVDLDNEFAKSHRELLPFFAQLAQLHIVLWQSSIAFEQGYFSSEDKYVSTAKRESVQNTFVVTQAQEVAVDVHAILKKCLEDAQALRQHGAIKRYMHELQNVSYANQPRLAPNYEKNYENSLVFMGAKGWRHSATEANVELLLKRMSISVTYGRDKLTKNLI